MTQRCHICIEEECKGKRNCHCDNCAKLAECPKVLSPTIRLTTRCTQSCVHCCFSCSPKRSEMMSPAMAVDVARFLRANDIQAITVMGGEVCCNPDWRGILATILPVVTYCRLVTNGDTVIEKGAAAFLKSIPVPALKVSVSKDRWHTNANVARAVRLLRRHGLKFNVATDEETTEDSLVPVGRGDMFYGPYAMFSCYCHNPQRRYGFLIDEAGKIFKCGFGAWHYADVAEHLDGSFAARFKEFGQRFYKAFVPNCATCYRCSRSAEAKRQKEVPV